MGQPRIAPVQLIQLARQSRFDDGDGFRYSVKSRWADMLIIRRNSPSQDSVTLTAQIGAGTLY